MIPEFDELKVEGGIQNIIIKYKPVNQLMLLDVPV